MARARDDDRLDAQNYYIRYRYIIPLSASSASRYQSCTIPTFCETRRHYRFVSKTSVIAELPKITGHLFETHPSKPIAEKLYSLPVGFVSGGGAPLPAQILAGQRRPAEPQWTTILFIPLSAPLHKLETDWARDCDKIILRRCPACERDSIIGHGRRSKQAHDEHHDWIGIRRGRCLGCGKTFTFLPLLSLPYTHYSLLARCQALRRRFVEHCSWEEAAPPLKDSNRVPEPSTLRRWASGLECSQLAPSFLRQTLARVAHWLVRGDQDDRDAWLASWLTPVLQTLWPLRL